MPLFPPYQTIESKPAAQLAHADVGLEAIFNFIDPKTHLHTRILGELRAIHHGESNTTLWLAPVSDPAHGTSSDATKFSDLPLDTEMLLVSVDHPSDFDYGRDF